jgi:HflK protein
LPWPVESHHLVARDRVQRLDFGVPDTLSREAATRAQIRDRPTFGSSQAPERISGLWFQKEMAPEDPSLLTGDGNLIDLRSAVQYRVKDALAFAYNIAEPEPLVRSTILSALRGVVAMHAIDAVYTSAREEIERSTREAAQAMLDQYQAGIEILTVRLLYVHPPEEVHDAFRDVASAQEDKLRTINLANVFAVEKINEAKGAAAAMQEAAAAYKEQRIKAARGDATAFALRLEAYKHAPDSRSSDCRSKRSKRFCQACENSFGRGRLKSRTSICGYCNPSGQAKASSERIASDNGPEGNRESTTGDHRPRAFLLMLPSMGWSRASVGWLG